MSFHAEFQVAGDPKPQPRGRAFHLNGKARIYNPATAEGWKSQIAMAAQHHAPEAALEGPVGLNVEFRFDRPQRLRKKKTPKTEIPHCSRPDCDNLAKAVLDTLTQLGWWEDDDQVCTLNVRKVYRGVDQTVGARICVWTL